jgi:hypothetical protein
VGAVAEFSAGAGVLSAGGEDVTVGVGGWTGGDWYWTVAETPLPEPLEASLGAVLTVLTVRCGAGPL